MKNIDIYNNSKIILERSVPNKILSWITILKMLTIMLIIFSFIPFNRYKSYLGYVDNDYITLFYNTDDFPFNKHDELYINYNKYNYNVVSIDKDSNAILIDIDDNIKLQNNIVKLYFLKGKTTIFDMVKNNIKKGLMR